MRHVQRRWLAPKRAPEFEPPRSTTPFDRAEHYQGGMVRIGSDIFGLNQEGAQWNYVLYANAQGGVWMSGEHLRTLNDNQRNLAFPKTVGHIGVVTVARVVQQPPFPERVVMSTALHTL